MFSPAPSGCTRAHYLAVSRLRTVSLFLASFLTLPNLCGAATLERLTFDEIATQATDVVCGRILGQKVEVRNESIYTHYTVQVRERWKGAVQQEMDVVLPGGETGGLRQTFAGVPQLEMGKEYVLFLWTGSSRRTQLIGLTQGLFEISENTGGTMTASRGLSPELMLDKSGKAVQDQPVRMLLSEMGSRVKNASRQQKVTQ